MLNAVEPDKSEISYYLLGEVKLVIFSVSTQF